MIAGTTVPVLAPPAPGGARWRASLWDYLAIVGWLVVLTVAGSVLRPVLPGSADDTHPLAADLAAFVLTVLPVGVYLTAGEGGQRQASWGKRRAGLRVVGPHGRRVTAGRAALRSAVKLAPWQLAHVAVARVILGADAPVTIAVTYTLSLVIPLVSITMAKRDPLRRALHDRAAGTRVVAASTAG